MNSVGEKIYNLRKDKGLSQEELAEKLNVARFTVSRWETNAAQPTAENIKFLCGFFGVTSAYFFDNEAENVKEEGQEAVASDVKNQAVIKEGKFKNLKIVSVVIGFVLLALFIIACGIGAYITISPGGGGVWSEEIHTVNYMGIVFLVIGIVAVAVLFAVSVLLILQAVKRKKQRKKQN